MFASTSDLNVDIIHELIDAGADVNGQLGSGVTVLMYACGEHDNLRAIQALLDAGANPSLLDNSGGSALSDAVLWGRPDAVKLLLQAGANPNGEPGGTPPIDYVEHAGVHAAPIKRLLVAAGANPLGSLAPVYERVANDKPQSLQAMFDRIKSVHQDLDRLHDSSLSNSDYRDSLYNLSEYLEIYLRSYLPRFAESVSADVPVDLGVTVVTSPDKKLREWSWDSYTGGSCPNIYELVEYATPKGTSTFDLMDIPPEQDLHNHAYDTIFTVVRSDGKTIYLPLQWWKADGMNSGQTLSAWIIEDTSLKRVKLFRTKKSDLSEITYQWPVQDENDAQERVGITVEGDRLWVPLLDKRDKPTDKSILYTFDSTHFVFTGTVKR
jgi:hypothetical protein